MIEKLSDSSHHGSDQKSWSNQNLIYRFILVLIPTPGWFKMDACKLNEVVRNVTEMTAEI